ncbi:hypothetical protein BC940DRAFT_298194 [Gongronella butleri]|nr:hypothetical protein BC940DRAFT_298194 [Gongronella butleri]
MHVVVMVLLLLLLRHWQWLAIWRGVGRKGAHDKVLLGRRMRAANAKGAAKRGCGDGQGRRDVKRRFKEQCF